MVNNRRRVGRAKNRLLQRKRSELCERTFAHMCETGGARRTWLRGLPEVVKRYLITAAAHNLGRILRSLFGIGKPRVLQGEGALALFMQLAILRFTIGMRKLAQFLCAVFTIHSLQQLSQIRKSTALAAK